MWSIPRHTWFIQGVLASHVVNSSAHMVHSGSLCEPCGPFHCTHGPVRGPLRDMWSILRHTWFIQGVSAGHVVHSTAHMVHSGGLSGPCGPFHGTHGPVRGPLRAMWSILRHTWSGQAASASHVVHSTAHMVRAGEIPDRPGDSEEVKAA